MKFLLHATTSALLAATSASACSEISDDTERLACYDAAHSGISVIRCVDLFGSAKCDLMTPTTNDMVSCMVYDAAGKPIARESAFGAAGLIIRDIPADQIDHVDCQSIG